MSVDSCVVVLGYQDSYYVKVIHGTDNLMNSRNTNFLQSIVLSGLEYLDFGVAYGKAIELDKKYKTELGITTVCLEGTFVSENSFNQPEIRVIDLALQSLALYPVEFAR